MVYQSLVIFAVSFFAVALSLFVLVAAAVNHRRRERQRKTWSAMADQLLEDRHDLWQALANHDRLDERIERYCDDH